MRGEFLKGVSQFLNKNSNGVFGALSVIGLGATVYFVAKGQMKADEVLAQREEYYKEKEEEAPKLTKVQKIKKIWKCFIPAGVAVVLTLTSIIAGNYISWKKITGLSATAAFLAADRDNLEKFAREKLGDETVDKVKEAVFKGEVVDKETGEVKTVVKFVPVDIVETGNGNTICIDTYSGRVFRSSREAIDKAFSDIFKQLDEEEYASLNDLYDYWGVHRTDFGSNMGWFYIKDDQINGIEGDSNIGSLGLQYSIHEYYDSDYGENVLAITLIDTPFEEFYEYPWG